MSRLLCPYAEEMFLCIKESRGETDIDCDTCHIKQDSSDLNSKVNSEKKDE